MVLALVLAELGGSFGILALMISGAVSYSKEINSKYSYMTFMTPNSTYKIVGAKYLSLLIVTVAGTLIFSLFLGLNIKLITDRYKEIHIITSELDELGRAFGFNTGSYIASFLATLVTMMISFLFSVSCAYVAITLSTTILANRKGKAFLSIVFFFVIVILTSFIAGRIPVMDYGDTFLQYLAGNIYVYLFRLCLIAGSYLFVSYMLKKKISL
ncbi:MAG: ABC-2 transporter permease [Butyrivibrio sp.]|nr:ABC-2 transporter permease [Butyrivibrio sp.]